MTKIIVFNEKHENRYFDATTSDAVLRAFYVVLKDRVEYNWYAPPSIMSEKRREELQEYTNVDAETVSRLPKDLQETILNARQQLEQYEEEFEASERWWNRLQAVLAMDIDKAICEKINLQRGKAVSQTPMLSWLYQKVQHDEYSGYEIVSIQTP